MLINLRDDKLVITFKYDPRVIDAIRQISGRKFDPDFKHWTVPADNVAEALQILTPAGFLPSKEVLELADRLSARLAQNKALKTEPTLCHSLLPLYDFQKIGVSFLSGMGSALLADVPGLGKTIQTIGALEACGQILILCPASLKYGWKKEIKKWTGDSVEVINGERNDRIAQWKAPAKWKIVNYELLLRDLEEMQLVQWDAIVCDEATRISNAYAKTVKRLKSLRAKRRIALTGTPISNSPKDIYSIIDWILPGYLGSFYQFTQNYCVMNPRYPAQILGYKNIKHLSNKIDHLILRRTKEEVLKDFPPKTITNIEFDLSLEEKQFYAGVKSLIIQELDRLQDIDKSTLAMAPVKLLRLKQAVDHPALISNLTKSTKLEMLKELLEPIMASGEKVLIFTQFAEMAKILYSELAIYQPKLIYGDIKSEDRARAVDEFTNEPANRVMIMTEAGAYGLNLQAASYVVHYDFPWSVAKLMQREDRAHRIGQTKPVTVYNLVARDTVDEYVAKVLYKKQKVSVEILKDAERLEASGLSAEDIKNILRI
jgi:SNF2 family DNA or RNA helicase